MRRLLGILAVLVSAQPTVTEAQATRSVILATTTSTQDSGLLDSLVPRFERHCRCRVKTIAIGTGQSLALGARGEADVVLVHAPSLEEQYVKEGVFVDRRLVMANDFVLVGPPSDSAGVKGSRSIGDALRKVAAGTALFASRADNSGTDILEKKLWKNIGVRPSGNRYVEVGQGMGATLKIASEKRAYTLTDRGTYLALRDGLDLIIVFEKSPELLNIYHVMEPNPDIFPNLNQQGGKAFADFMVSPEAQSFIGKFGVARFGQPLFTPAAGRKESELGATVN